MTTSGADRRGRETLSTGDMARLSNSTLRTVRFYEEEGLIEPQGRSEGGHRQFAPTELAKLQLALDLREAGLSIGDIKSLFELKSACNSPEDATEKMSNILEGQIEEMQKKISKLRGLREELTSMVEVIANCRSCENPEFPLRCTDCDVLDRSDVIEKNGLPRALDILWRA